MGLVRAATDGHSRSEIASSLSYSSTLSARHRGLEAGAAAEFITDDPHADAARIAFEHALILQRRAGRTAYRSTTLHRQRRRPRRTGDGLAARAWPSSLCRRRGPERGAAVHEARPAPALLAQPRQLLRFGLPGSVRGLASIARSDVPSLSVSDLYLLGYVRFKNDAVEMMERPSCSASSSGRQRHHG